MIRKCGKCDKTVYPTEEVKCLDKSWHKGCFRCWECNTALSMKNYKGFNKLPYCSAHVPKPKATAMAETPELARIAENTKIQSNVKYHAEFEASKGKFTAVVDDPETLRLRQNAKIISNAAYHGDLERKESMEQRRHMNELSQYCCDSDEKMTASSSWKQPAITCAQQSYGLRQQLPKNSYTQHPVEASSGLRRSSIGDYITPGARYPSTSNGSHYQHIDPRYPSSTNSNFGRTQTPESAYSKQNYYSQTGAQSNNGAENQYSTQRHITPSSSSHPMADRSSAAAHHVPPAHMSPRAPQTHMIRHTAGNSGPDSHHHVLAPPRTDQYQAVYHTTQTQSVTGPTHQLTEPLSAYGAGRQSGYPQQQQFQQPHSVYSNQRGQWQSRGAPCSQLTHSGDQQQSQQHHMPQYDTTRTPQLAGHAQGGYTRHPASGVSQSSHSRQPLAADTGPHVPAIQQPRNGYRPSGRCYRAMYDYDAMDYDEISFRDGDLIVNCEPIDEGWMTGTCQRSGQCGMLPANYVQPVQL